MVFRNFECGVMMVFSKKVIVCILLMAGLSTLGAVEYYKECDFNDDGKISGRIDWKAGLVDKETAKKETKCRGKKGLAKAEEELAKVEEKLAKVEEKLAKSKGKLAKSKGKLAKSKEELAKSKGKLAKNKKLYIKQRKWMIRKIRSIDFHTITSCSHFKGNKPKLKTCQINRYKKELAKIKSQGNGKKPFNDPRYKEKYEDSIFALEDLIAGGDGWNKEW